MKICKKCNKERELSSFQRNNKTCVCCNSCASDMQDWYKKNRERWIAKMCAYSKTHWPEKIVSNSKKSDAKKKRPWKEADYITAGFLLNKYQEQEGACFWCGVMMQMWNRQMDDGLTIERLDNSLPHTRDNCCLACFECNVKKWFIEKEPFLLC